MRDEELWHADNNRLSKDQRDDRRDFVTPPTGPLGFSGELEDENKRAQEASSNEEGASPAVGNDVESYTDEYAEEEENLKEQRESDTQGKDPRKPVTRPLPEGSDFRSNRQTAKVVPTEELEDSAFTQDQGTPPDHDGGKLTPRQTIERNEPERSPEE